MSKIKKPRVKLAEKLEEARLMGYHQGYRQAQADLEVKAKAFTQTQNQYIQTQRFEAKLKLINAAGQAFQAISSALSDDSVAGGRF